MKNYELVWKIFLSIITGVLYFVGFVGFEQWYLSWICLIPILFAFEGVTLKRGIFLGLIFGITLNLGGFYWIAHTMRVFALLPWVVTIPILFLFAIAQATEFAFFGFLYVLLKRRSKLSAIFLAPIAFVTAEFLSPQIFPHYLANSQYKQIPLIQMCDITGVLGLTALIVFVNAVIYIMIERFLRERRFAWKPFVSMTIILSTVLAYGYLRISQVEKIEQNAPKLKFGISQIDMGIYEKMENPGKAISLSGWQTKWLKESGADIVVWPETAVQRPIEFPGLEVLPKYFFENMDIPVLTGAILKNDLPSGGYNFFNIAALTNNDGSVLGIYRKQKLLIFGEYIPLGDYFPSFYNMLPYIGRFKGGESNDPLRFRNFLFSVNICYEDIIPRLINRMMKSSPNVIINITNDNWFGETHEPLQHLILAAFRSVEQRRWLVRSTNTGISAFVSATGKIVKQTPLMKQATLSEDVPMMTGKTIYSRFGDFVGWLAIALSILFIRLRRRPRACPWDSILKIRFVRHYRDR